MIRNILFDIGGVLLTLDPARSISRFEALGLTDADRFIDAYRQSGFFLDLETGRMDAPAFCRALSEVCGRPVSHAEASHAWLGFVVDMPQYKLDYMAALVRRGYRVGVLSNNNPFIMEWMRSPALSAAGRPLSDYLSPHTEFISYEMRCTKPGPEIFAAVADAGLVPAETLFVDDSAKNVAAARAAGFCTIHAGNGTDFRPDVEAALAASEDEEGPAPSEAHEPAYRARLSPARSDALFVQIMQSVVGRRAYLHPHYTARQLAEELHVDPRHISAAVAVHTGHCFNHLVNTYRLRLACRRLRNARYAGLTAEDIGLSCGFASRQAFYLAFRKHYGTTPQRYRAAEEA